MRTTLAGLSGVKIIQVPFYHAAAKEMWSNHIRWGGGTLLDEAFGTIIVKWTGRGLVQATLEAIASAAFGWTPPGS